MDNIETKNIESLRRYLSECAVLLKKDNSFPIEKPCRIAAYGNGVRKTIKGGTGSGEVNSRYFINIEKALEDTGFEIINKDWIDRYDNIFQENKKRFIKGIKDKAKATKTNVISASMGAVMLESDYDITLNYDGDISIYVLSRISGEGNDRLNEAGDYKLTNTEIKTILDLNNHYEKFMLVINAGGPVDLSEVLEVKNILVLSQLGVEAGYALTDILLGKENPSGKLSTTWSKYEDYDIKQFANQDDTEYNEGIYFGYRYFDLVDKKALFPFGYGLSYTEFKYSFIDINANKNIINVDVEVENTGKYPGKEVIQLYLNAPVGKIEKEFKSLVAFNKTKELKPGEKEIVHLNFDIRYFASYDISRASYVLEAGDYILYLGNNSRDVKAISILELDNEFIVRKVKNLLVNNIEEKSLTYTQEKLDLKRIKLDLSSLETEIINYEDEIINDERLDNLTDEELSLLNIGAFKMKGGILSVIGDASSLVAGAAGETTSLLKDKGIDPIVVADGPAGIRISRQYYIDKNEKHSIGSPLPETIFDIMPKPLKWFMNFMSKPKKNVAIYEQYCTALPIGTAIAQSFNLEFAQLCGDIVGREMEKYNIDLWLAPALNIHRDVLCGRNFEYFSEDPFLSGKLASALTIGVQNHKGKGVTIKHYAANNQETNRYSNSSNLSERALREIYLKGFEICIKESKPMAVMSSYNLINGTHTSESKELCVDILRKEFGFEGLLMTDWIVAGFLTSNGKYPSPNSIAVAKAGHSLYMPGSKNDYDLLVDGIKNNKITTQELKRNAYWLLNIIDKTKSS